MSKGGGRKSLGEPWVELGVSRATYFRNRKNEIEKLAYPTYCMDCYFYGVKVNFRWRVQ